MGLVGMIAKQCQEDRILAIGVHPRALETEMSQDALEEFKSCELPYHHSGCSIPTNTLVTLEVLTDNVDLIGAVCVQLTESKGETVAERSIGIDNLGCRRAGCEKTRVLGAGPAEGAIIHLMNRRGLRGSRSTRDGVLRNLQIAAATS